MGVFKEHIEKNCRINDKKAEVISVKMLTASK